MAVTPTTEHPVPSGWRTTTLGDLAHIQRGASPRPITDPKWFDARSEIGWVRISDATRVQRRVLTETADHLSPAGVANSRFLPAGSLIMSICATIGIPTITGFDTCIHDGFVGFTELRDVDQQFLLFKLRELEATFRGLGQTGSQANLNSDLVRSCEVVVPRSLSEQKAIAEILCDLDDSLVALDHLIAKQRLVYRGAAQFILAELSGRVPQRPLCELADVDPENLPASTDPDARFRYIALDDVKRGSLMGWTVERFGSSPSRARRRLRAGDVLFGTVRPELRSHLLFDREDTEVMWIGSTGFSALRCKSGVAEPQYLFHCCMSDAITSQVKALTAGSNYPAVSSKDVASLMVPAPSLQEQVTQGRRLADMQASIDALQQRRGKLEEVRRTAARDLLTGTVRVS